LGCYGFVKKKLWWLHENAIFNEQIFH
jgi:hypothetical protein